MEIDCKDCHGTADKLPNLRTSGPAALGGGIGSLTLLRTPDGRRRFEWIGGTLFQRSMVDPNLEWKVSLVKNTRHAGQPGVQRQGRARQADEPRQPHARAGPPATCRTWRTRTRRWSATAATPRGPPAAAAATCPSRPMPRPSAITTRAARPATSPPTTRRWRATTCSCWACASPRPAARSRRSDPVRHWCCPPPTPTASSIYVQQAPIAASGFSSQAFNPHYPHTERKTETKTCTDCHLSAAPMTTTPSWRSCWRREPTTSTSSATTPMWAARAKSAPCRSPSGRNRRR